MLCGARGSWGAVGAAGVRASTPAGWRGGVCVTLGLGRCPTGACLVFASPGGSPTGACGHTGGPGAQGGCGARLPGAGAQLPTWLPMRPVASTPPPAGGGRSPPTPCGAVGPGPRGRALPRPIFAAPRAACVSSSTTTVHGRGLGLGRRSGCGWVWWCRWDWWRWRARGSPCSPVPWGCMQSDGVGGCGPAGTRARSHPQGSVGIRARSGSGASAGCGLTLRVGRGAGTLLVDPGTVWSGRGLSVGLECGLQGVPGRGASCLDRGALRHEGSGGGVGDGGGVPCWALLLPDLGWLGPEAVEDVLGGWSWRCRCGAGLGLELGFGCGLSLACANGFEPLLGGGLGFRLGCGCRFHWGVGFGSGGVARGGEGFRGPFGRLSPRLGGCWWRMRWLWWLRLWGRRWRRGLLGTAGDPGRRGRASDAGSCR